MPELLEVERYRILAEGALGRRVADVATPDPWYLKGAAAGPALGQELVGARFSAARRIGKVLLLDTEAGPVVGIRFGMTGTLLLDGEDAVGPLLHVPNRTDPAWDRWSVTFDDGGRLVVRDPRRLGGVFLDLDLTGLGPDAAAVGLSGLAAALAGSGTPLKARLLDQSRLAGVGNLIADELLWRAGFSPCRPAGSLTSGEVRRLHRHLRATLAELTARGGSHTGDLQEERRPGGRCPRDGHGLLRATVGGRTTWWCPAHQR